MKPLSQWSIVTKLLAINFLVFLIIGGVMTGVFFSYRAIDQKMTTIVYQDVSQVIENARVGRELTRVIADTSYMIDSFLEQEDLLETEGNRLTKITTALIAQDIDPRLGEALQEFIRDFQTLLEQGVAIRRTSQELNARNHELDKNLKDLEDLIVKTGVLAMMENREVSELERMSLHIPWYRESLLRVRILLDKLLQEHLHIELPEKGESERIHQILTLLDELSVRLKPLTDLEPNVADSGQQIIDAIQEYRKTMTAFYEELTRFQRHLNDLDEAKRQVLTVTEKINKEIAQAIGHIQRAVTKNIQSSGNAMIFFSVVVIVVLGSMGIYAVSITRPILHLTASATEIAAGNLDAPIPISGEDELGRLARSFVHMRDEIREKISALNREIEERKQAEEALRESEERFRSIFSQSPIGIELFDKDGHLINVNATCLEMFGVKDVETVKGFKLFEDPNLPQDAKQRLLNGESVRYEMVFDFELVKQHSLYKTTKSGECFIECFLTQWGSGTGDLKGFLVHVTDITERKQAEQALQESERKYRDLYNSVKDGIARADMEGHILESNPAFLDMLGFTFDELQQFTYWQLIPSKWYQKLNDVITNQLLKQGYSEEFEGEWIKKDGTTLPVSTRGWLVKDEQGNPTGIWAVIRDISDRKRAEEQLKNQNLLLEQAVQEKQLEMEALFERLLRQEKLATIGQIAGSIAHELRNPLGAVKNSIFFLKRLHHKQCLDVSNPKVKEHLDLIETELNISKRVIADLLHMTRMKPLQKEQIELRPIIEDAVEHCHLPEQIRLTLELPSEALLILADSMQLRQVFINLITNAAQAIVGEGSILISAKQLIQNESLVIEIEDTGNGIEPAALDKIFEPLYTTKTTGTGFGLSICKQIIENHQGHISLMSQVGQGTTVTIVLPDQKTIR
jgi:PAS domain S-box-containing protein